MYWYLTVRPDRRHDGSVATGVLLAHLDAVPGLRRTDLASYQAEDGREWLDVSIAARGEAAGYAVHEGRVPARVDVVELICSTPDGYTAALAVATGIADLLGWEVVDSESDEVLHAGAAPST
ncbi:hypothetical protein ACFVSN_39340 [Kitasatospora sp. NPDC057904]|uniref:hypothetical protein n=1 Tax=Kitasatospora sp. NPDC057904 TaxID=3346275 RepID=UPI0036D95585